MTAMPTVAEIRGLTIREPWATAIIRLGKWVENRTQRTSYRGLVAIHAAGTVERDAFADVVELAASVGQQISAGWLERHIEPGRILAAATLADCHESRDECCEPWGEPDAWHWLLEDVQPLAEPIACRGMQGLWPLPADIEHAVQSATAGG